MISFTNTIHIARPAPLVYDYLVDLEHLPEWNWAITGTVKATPGPIEVGTRFVQTRRSPRLATEHLQIAALSPHHHIEIDGTLAGFDARVVYDLSDDGAETALANTIVLDTPQLPHLASRLLGPHIKRSVASNLGDLQVRLTGGTSPSEHRSQRRGPIAGSRPEPYR